LQTQGGEVYYRTIREFFYDWRKFGTGFKQNISFIAVILLIGPTGSRTFSNVYCLMWKSSNTHTFVIYGLLFFFSFLVFLAIYTPHIGYKFFFYGGAYWVYYIWRFTSQLDHLSLYDYWITYCCIFLGIVLALNPYQIYLKRKVSTYWLRYRKDWTIFLWLFAINFLYFSYFDNILLISPDRIFDATPINPKFLTYGMTEFKTALITYICKHKFLFFLAMLFNKMAFVGMFYLNRLIVYLLIDLYTDFNWSASDYYNSKYKCRF
jgi:hypothetical protein